MAAQKRRAHLADSESKLVHSDDRFEDQKETESAGPVIKNQDEHRKYIGFERDPWG